MKKKIQILISIIFIIVISCISKADEIDHSKHQCIYINVTNLVDLGEAIQGNDKNNFWDDDIIKFEINCCSDKKIRITKLLDVESSKFDIKTEWKAGPYTGFELPYYDGIFTPQNKKFYVTVRLKSIKVPEYTSQGNYYFNPTIKVEYFDM